VANWACANAAANKNVPTARSRHTNREAVFIRPVQAG
jgi:hypothetical protein